MNYTVLKTSLHVISFMKCKTKQSTMAAQHANQLTMKAIPVEYKHV